eukprot:jgi/Picsp_1/5031/NSC_02394-R1_dna-binding protein smubp-2-like
MEKGSLESKDYLIEKFTYLLSLEHEAEKLESEFTLDSIEPRTAQAKGLALLNLRIDEVRSGLLGKTLITLVPNKKNASGEAVLPCSKISQHDLVRLKANNRAGKEASSKVLLEGIVYKLSEMSVTVAVDEYPDEYISMPLKVEKIANHITHKRLCATLAELGNDNVDSRVHNVMFNKVAPSRHPQVSWEPLNKELDESQVKAVHNAIVTCDIALIHGPPGTGKTTALVEYIAQEVLRGSRVLACAASNIAVDNLVEKLSQIHTLKSKEIRMIRIGHPARLLPEILSHSLDHKILHSDDSSLARDCRNEIKSLNQKMVKLDRCKNMERREIKARIRDLYKEERKRQKMAIDRVMDGANVVCCTLSTAAASQIKKLPIFDVVVIDEAGQATEPSCWTALLKGRKAVLAGDHLQLRPTVLSQKAARNGLAVTLFERIQKMWGSEVSKMLLTQYRMNSKIMSWSSTQMYDSALIAHESVTDQTLDPLLTSNSQSSELKSCEFPVLLYIDTAGCDMEEENEEDGNSIRNPGEADLVFTHVQMLLSAGVGTQDIGIITPYSAQVALLRSIRNEKFKHDLEIGTIDGFQGREKEAIIISMVRSNDKQEVGFLSDERRMNVAITRAKRHCVLIGDSETISSNDFLNNLLEHFQDYGDYESAASYAM